MAAARGEGHDMRRSRSDNPSAFHVVEDAIHLPWLEDSLDAVKLICKKIVPRWGEIPLEELRVEKVSGGITNILFSVTPSRPGKDPVVVRIFGPMTEKVIDREQELQAMQALSDGGFGAHLIGRFGNGVVQSFIHAKTLDTQEMCSLVFVPKIAAALSRFHRLDIPISKQPQLWPTIRKFFRAATNLSFEDPKKQTVFKSINFDRLREHIAETERLAAAVSSPVVFSHNDLLAGNIMYSQEDDVIHLIDFEYSAYGFRGYDLANHFCEYAGFECDYSRFPDHQKQCLFFRHYLNASNPDQVSESELAALAAEVRVFVLASHLYWAVWALIQARYSPIDFDFLGYFDLRYSEFQKNLAKYRT